MASRSPITLCLVILSGLLGAAGASGGPSRYAPLLATRAGQDTLRDIALWEDQRVTGDDRIFQYLKDGSPLVQRRALEALGRIQNIDDAAGVASLLRSSNAEVRREAIFALGQIGNRIAVADLLAAREGASAEDLEVLAEALGKLGGDEGVAGLTDMLRDFNASVRRAAALGLTRAKHPNAAGALLLAVHDPDPTVRSCAVYALEKQDPLPNSCQTVQRFLEDDDARVRAAAARTAGKLGCQTATKGVIALLRDEDIHVVINAARALGELKARDAVRPLSSLVMSGRSLHVRATAAEALEKIGDKGGKDALMQGLLDTSVLVRAHSVRGLAACLGERSGMFVDQARRDGSRLVRAEAIECYGRAGIKERIGELEVIASGDKDPMMRAAAVTALGQIKDSSVGPLLPPKLRDPDFTVAAAAVDAIAGQEYRQAIPLVMEAYDARDDREFVDVQLAAVRVLGEMGAVEAESLLVDATAHRDYRVRAAAVESLQSLGLAVPPVPSDREMRAERFDPSRRNALAPPSGTRHAVIVTKHGDIEVELFGDDAIQTVAMFLQLAKNGFYRGLTVHRVVPNFVVQGGDPRGDGNGDAGFTLPAETNRHHYNEGFLGIADAGKDTGSCQWFITLSPQPHLDGRYTIFGRVTGGMDVVWKIDRGDEFEVRPVD